MRIGVLPAILVLALPAYARQSPADDPLSDGHLPAQSATALTPQTMACLVLSDDECGAGANATKLLTADAHAVAVAAPRFGVQQNFERLSRTYPYGSVQDVLTLIGRPTESWITNTCAIRMSYAMNHAGFRIDKSVASSPQAINFISDKSGAEKDAAYIYRVDEFAGYLLMKYGKPQVWAKKGDNLRQVVYGKKGIILFVVNGWSDATGHFDLWDGEKAAEHDYFDQSSDVFVWQ